jgi:hypothetical protein
MKSIQTGKYLLTKTFVKDLIFCLKLTCLVLITMHIWIISFCSMYIQLNEGGKPFKIINIPFWFIRILLLQIVHYKIHSFIKFCIFCTCWFKYICKRTVQFLVSLKTSNYTYAICEVAMQGLHLQISLKSNSYTGTV